MKVFKKEDFEIRVIEKDGEPWFIARDVCNALGYADVETALRKLDEDEKLLRKIHASGQMRTVSIISESGMYTLIMRSSKPTAKEFRRWVTGEVLPSIRKHGAYMTEKTLEKALNDPDFLIELATKLKEERALREASERKNRELIPKAKYFDDLVDRNLLTNFRDTAKELHMGQKEFIQKLLDDKYLYRDIKGALKPYIEYVDSGLFELKEWANDAKAGVQTLITPKGRETFKLLMVDRL